MLQERVPIYKVLEVLEERYGKGTDSLRRIARSVEISRPTVAKYLGLAEGSESCIGRFERRAGTWNGSGRLFIQEKKETAYRDCRFQTGRRCENRAETEREERRDPTAALRGVQAISPGEVRLQPVLRALQGIPKKRRSAVAHSPSARKETLCRLFRTEDPDRAPGEKPYWVKLFVAVMDDHPIP